METKIIDLIKTELKNINPPQKASTLVYRKANALFLNGQSKMLSQSKQLFEFSVDDEFDDYKVKIYINNKIETKCNCKSNKLCPHKLASLMQLHEELTSRKIEPSTNGKKYTRDGMIRRVLKEREEKAARAVYEMEFADNIYGEHILYNEKGDEYKLTFYNFKKEHGYCSCPDYSTNKLGTCKHLMYAFKYNTKLKRTPQSYKHPYPFIEIFLHPLKDYKISWFYPGKLDEQVYLLINKYFGDNPIIADDKVLDFLGFLNESKDIKKILIRQEVQNLVEKAYDREMLKEIKEHTSIDFSSIKLKLFPYQIEGIEFATFKEGAIIADEMGLGKTIQAIGTAMAKKNIFGFERTLIICPASIKDQWKSEIEKNTNEKASVVEGTPEEREEIYEKCENYFLIVNYETALRDYQYINKNNTDFIILDEAQRIKNYSSQTSNTIKSLKKKHSLIITGTPIENRLIDLYSIVAFIDLGFISPLWEFSYQHCYYDIKQKNKITAYYNLISLKEKLSLILLRREKKDVIKQLPNISELNIPVEMHPEQRKYHSTYGVGIAKILNKKFVTPFDMQRLMQLLSKMRMVCDSTYLVDFETNYSPKLAELKYILFEKLDIKLKRKKIIIFSEWKRMNNIIAKILRDENINYVELNGSVPVIKRGSLIREFEENDDCKVFISTETGGSGLNLQVADTVINFELPWNPAKKNQRIGRIDRIGQTNKNLTVINFITKNSIEEKIADGLILKQNLFDGVLNQSNDTETVDFSEKDRFHFLKQLEDVLVDLEKQNIARESEHFLHKEANPADLKLRDQVKTSSNKTKEKDKQLKLFDLEQTEVQENTINKDTSEELERILNQGIGFLSGLLKITTGKEIRLKDQSFSIDKITNEVTMKFKLPKE